MKKVGLLLFVLISFGMSAQNEKSVYTYNVGDISVSTLSESQGNGQTKILIGATPDMVGKYLPDGTFPNAVNAFFVKTPDKTILVDAGFGRKLFDNLKDLNVLPEQVDVILLTHMHGDHIGGLLRDGQKAFPNAELYISNVEHDYWIKENKDAQKNVISIYKDKLKLFDAQESLETSTEVIPGVKAFAAYGHTPGHTIFQFHSGNQCLLVWGDLTHAMKIQMPCPEVAVTYDVDPDLAIKSRKKILKYVSENNIPIAGMHIAYPAIGTIKSNQGGGYIFDEFK